MTVQEARGRPVANPAVGFGHLRIVTRARAFIEARLEHPITVEEIASAAFASRRTLHRAFHEILGETPHAFVLRLRLGRVRDELAAGKQAASSVTAACHRWGMPEMGRMAARYRAQFGELPSETMARRHCSGASQVRACRAPVPPRNRGVDEQTAKHAG